MSFDLNIGELYMRGVRESIAAHDAEERAKVGTFRGGSSGIFIDDDTLAGKCHRLALARVLGVDAPMDEAGLEDWERRQLMFEAGLRNEDAWAAALQAGGLPAGWSLKREEEIPVSWVLSHSGREYPVGGRPDLVIVDADGVPRKGIELKLAASVYTARDVLFNSEPNLDHLIQAAHYSLGLGGCLPGPDGTPVSYELWYTNRVDFHVPHFFSKKKDGKWEVKQDDCFPASPSAPLAKYVEFNPKGQVKKIKQFIAGYALRWASRSGDIWLEYSPLTPGAPKYGQWCSTPISRGRIVDFFRYVADTSETKDLGPRVATLRAGGQKHRFSKCDYCPVQAICDAHEDNFDEWLSALKDADLARERMERARREGLTPASTLGRESPESSKKTTTTTTTRGTPRRPEVAAARRRQHK